jgi:hypothetical protein
MNYPFVRLLVFFCAALVAHAAQPITPAGEQLAQVLDGMDVEHHWPAGVVVNWRTGDPTGKAVKDDGKHTHCSQFVSAVAEKLGVEILDPRQHSPTLLANAQYDWLRDHGAEAGWKPVADGVAAQDLANQGYFVVASYKNHDATRPGHIAIVRPGKATPREIALHGPDVIQAGTTSHNVTTLKQGFSNHPRAFPENAIAFYAHAPAPAKLHATGTH